MRTNPHTLQYNAGMTLIELLVVLGIFVVITSVVIFDYGSVRSHASLQNLASDIALAVRKSQSYAIGAFGTGAAFSYGYGVHFSTAKVPVANPQNGSNKSFVLFTDISGNKIYDTNGGPCSSAVTAANECSEMLSITTGDEIASIYLDGSNTPTPVGSTIDVVFIRPNPDAYFCYKVNSSSASCDATALSSVVIQVENMKKSLQGTGTKTITIRSTGQISIQ